MAMHQSLIAVLVLLLCGTIQARQPRTEIESEGGRLERWDREEFPALEKSRFNADRIVVESNGLVSPMFHNVGSLKTIVRGSGVIGVVNAGDRVSQRSQFRVREGDVIAIPRGHAFWFYNDQEERAEILGVGFSHIGRNPRDFDLFNVATAFSPRVLAQALDIFEERVQELVERQQNRTGIIKVSREVMQPQRSTLNVGATHLVHQLGTGFPEARVRNGGELREVNSRRMPSLEHLSMAARYMRLEGGALFAPNYVHNGDKLMYVVQGSARLEVISSKGERVVGEELRQGDLALIPSSHPHALLAGDEGFYSFEVINHDRPETSFLAGGNSVHTRIPRGVLSGALGVSADVTEELASRRPSDSIIFPARERRSSA